MNRIVGLFTVRNEDWVLGLSARAALMWCDSIIIFNHRSTDGTRAIAHELRREHGQSRVLLMESDDVQWSEMTHRQATLAAARELAATHMAVIDADEILSGNLIGSIRGLIEPLPAGTVLQIPWIMMWRDHLQYRSDPASKWTRAQVSLAFRDREDLCWRDKGDGYCFHHRHPYNSTQTQAWRNIEHGGLMHLQHVRWDALLAKQALYQMIEVIRWPGREDPREIASKYRGTVDEAGLERTDAPPEWWAPYADIMHHLHLDREPWQAAECRRLWDIHGAYTFRGLDLFGVVQ